MHKENGTSGTVFSLLFGPHDKDNFALSSIIIGQGIVIIKPSLEGEWIGMRVVSSPEPTLLNEPNWNMFIPGPFLETVSCV
jgi:hypothetical protein